MQEQAIYTRDFFEASLNQAAKRYIDCSSARLIELSLKRQESQLAANGALLANTGVRTGRSPKDRYIVRDELTESTVDWGSINQPFNCQDFDHLWKKALKALAGNQLFISHLYAGAESKHQLPVTVITELAWHNLFAQQLFVRPDVPPTKVELDHLQNQWTILNLPSLSTDPEYDNTNSDGAVLINFSQRCVLLLGMRYAGEMKKSIFSVMNFLMPEKNILTMHCSSNQGEKGDVALFFGLSGTGKTTLSADPERYLIGDDEHGWDERGIFNLEGGCYAKCIDLSEANEPVIWQAIRFGAILENVILDENTREPDYHDRQLTENTRVAYPREFIPMRVEKNRGGHPNAIIFLTCDLYGVLPPVAFLSKEQAAYHFLSGYTALLGGTEVGQKNSVKTTFSACFGAPFFPRAAQVYADLLMKKIEQHQVPVYLVSTGWTGGGYNSGGQRISIADTRAIIRAILAGKISPEQTSVLPGLNLAIPNELPNVEAKLLNPRENWLDPKAYDEQCKSLIELFQQNFDRFDVSDEIRAAGPNLTEAS